MVFPRVLFRNSRSTDGRVEKTTSPPRSKKGFWRGSSSSSSEAAVAVNVVTPVAKEDDKFSASSPVSIRTAQTASPFSNDGLASPALLQQKSQQQQQSRQASPAALPERTQGTPHRARTSPWMRILPLEEQTPTTTAPTTTPSSSSSPSHKNRIPTVVHTRSSVPAGSHNGNTDHPPLTQSHTADEEDDILLLMATRARSLDPDDDGLDAFLDMPISPSTSTLKDDAFSQTIVAGNLIMTSSVLLLSSVVNLSVLKPCENVVLSADGDSLVRPGAPGRKVDPQAFFFAPPAAKTVQDSLTRHVHFHLYRQRNDGRGMGGLSFEAAEYAVLPRLQAASPARDADDDDATPLPTPPSLSDLPLNPSTVNGVVQNCLKANNIQAAVTTYQTYLSNQQNKSGSAADNFFTQSPTSSFSTPERSHHSAVSNSVVEGMDAQRADTLGKLAILSLLAGQCKEALQYALEAARMHKESSNRPLATAMSAMLVGLIHFATSRAGRALKAWREAMQLCCLAVGYDHPIVAVLLNNIGVLHYDSGDSLAAIRALEESLDLQRSMLKSGLAAVHVDHALYQMATTMGNLAMALELNERFDRAIALLQESEALYESVEGDEETDMSEALEVVHQNVERLVLQRDRFLDRGRNELSLLHSASGSVTEPDGSTADGDRSTALFGNADGIPIKNGQAALVDTADNHDYLLLGLVSKELTPRQRVREIVLTWFGRTSDDPDGSVVVERTPFVPFEQVSSLDEDDPMLTQKPPEADRSSTVGQPTSPEKLQGNGGSRDLKKAASSASSERPEFDVSDSEPPPELEVNLQGLHFRALEHLDHHEIGDALDLFVAALNIHKDKYGDDHHLVGAALHNIGMVHLFAEEYLQAYGIFKEAARIRSVSLGVEHPDAAASTVKIGLLQYAAMDIAAASRTFGQVREIYLSSMGYAHPHLAKIMNNIGVLRYEEGDCTGATRAFEIAYEYQRRLVEEHPGNSAAAEIAMGYTLANIGFLSHRQDELISAVQLFEEARATLSRHLRTDDPKLVMVQQNIEYLVGKGVDMAAPCEEGCQLTPNARHCLMQLPRWR
jgi:tetratricopeptide (TPR) repeat protein